VEVRLTGDQRALVREAIESGRYNREEDIVQEALLLWETRERRRVEILAAVDQAEASVARGESRHVSTREEALQLAVEIKRRCEAGLADAENVL
jgi:Arc/MetJ-type ribon-helix-helix transcriptional regulator